jgi:hypothetical protein
MGLEGKRFVVLVVGAAADSVDALTVSHTG